MRLIVISAVFFTMCTTACSTTRSADLKILGDPPAHLKGSITTQVEWLSTPQVAARCASLLLSFGYVPIPAYGCTYKQINGGITLVLPYDLHPLIVHELAHAHQIRLGEPVSHADWKRMTTPK